jgi:hypothetical protein
VKEGIMDLEKEISREEMAEEEASVVEIEEIEKDLKCMRLFAVIAARDAKFLLSQPETSLFTVVNVSQITEELQDLTVVLKEETATDLDVQTDQCLTQFVVLVEKDLNYLSGQPETSQFTVANVLKRKAAVQAEVLAPLLINTRNSLKC